VISVGRCGGGGGYEGEGGCVVFLGWERDQNVTYA